MPLWSMDGRKRRRERNALRIAQQTNRMKDEFLATVSHELRNPLNAIRGWVQILQTPRDQDTVGALVTTAASAAEAFAIIRADRPDVLVCDIGMPVEDGYSLIQRIRGDSDPAIASLPAAALTAYASTHDRLRALEAGFQFHLTKPVTIANLTGIVGVLATRADWPIPQTNPGVG